MFNFERSKVGVLIVSLFARRVSLFFKGIYNTVNGEREYYMREKTKLDKFLLKLFPRKKVEDLIKHLEDKEQLNRGNVRWRLNVRTVEHQFLKTIFIITLIVSCIGFLHVIYNITFF